MLALSIVAYHMVMNASPQAQCAFFADNWSVCGPTFSDLQNSLAALEETTKKLKMKIAPSKSWSWGTTSKMRKECSLLKVNDSPIPLVHCAHDLGMQQNYTKKQSKKTIKKKVDKAKAKLKSHSAIQNSQRDEITNCSQRRTGMHHVRGSISKNCFK